MPNKLTPWLPRTILTTAGLVLLLCGGIGLADRYKSTRQPAAAGSSTNSSQTSGAAGRQPAESPVDGGSFKTAADQPRRIRIASVGIDGFIQKVGTDKNAVAAPSNVNLAGWFSGSPKPGEVGASIIDGHVQGRYTPGIFKKLAQVKAGDSVSIEYGDGSVRNFAVTAAMSKPENEAGPAMYAMQAGISKQLTLITCAGKYDKQTGRYSDRTLVYAKITD